MAAVESGWAASGTSNDIGCEFSLLAAAKLIVFDVSCGKAGRAASEPTRNDSTCLNLQRNNDGLFLRQAPQEVLAGAQMFIHQPRRRMREPLRRRNILVCANREHLEKDQVIVPGVLDVVRTRDLDVADVALLEVH